MEILFLGGLFPKETEKEIASNSIGNLQNAANNLQWEIVKGLEENLNKPITIINSLYIGSYPKRYKKLKIQTYSFTRDLKQSTAVNVGFYNIPGIKNVSRYITLKPFIRKWINKNDHEKKIIIAYAMTSTFTQILEYVKEIDSDVTTCLIVPDLPKYMNLTNKKNALYNVLKDIDFKIIEKNMNYIDSYVVLTRYMTKALNINRPSVVIEGISTDVFEKTIEQEASIDINIKKVVYTGGLNEKYGIIELIKAFELLENDNYRLIICGSGDSEKAVQEAANRDERIEFKGLLKRQEIITIQSNATLLINPRSNDESYAKYSFPSKILEYMSSGRPVLAYMLDGIPEEYEKYIYTIDANKENSIYHALKNTLDIDETFLYEKGKIGKNFVITNKGRKEQCEKIINMLQNI